MEDEIDATKLDRLDRVMKRLAMLKKGVKYKTYQSLKPCANKILQIKFDKEAKDKLSKKLVQVTPRINTSPPRKYVISRAKQLKLRQDKVSQIEASNQVLLQRILHQQKSRKPLGGPKASKTPVDGRGLNGPYKKELQQQVSEENRALMARLESQRAHYGKSRWLQEREKNLFYLANIANHPDRFIDEIEDIEKQLIESERNDPHNPLVELAELDRLIEMKEKLLMEIEASRLAMDVIPGKWAPKAPLLPRAAMQIRSAPQTPATPSGPKKFSEFMPRLAQLVADSAKRAIVEVKTPVSAIKEWDETKKVEVEMDFLFKKLQYRKISLSQELRKAAKQVQMKTFMESRQKSKDQMNRPMDRLQLPLQGSGAIVIEDSEPNVKVTSVSTTNTNSLPVIAVQDEDDDEPLLESGNETGQSVPELAQPGQIEHTIDAVITGIPGLAPSYPIPDPTSKTVWLFFSSTTQDTMAERDLFFEKCVPDLRNLCRSFGLEFRCSEILGGSVHEALQDKHQIPSIYLRELNRCIQESAATNFVIILGDNYGARNLPAEIPSSTFKLLMREVASMGNDAIAGVNRISHWYKLDENKNPPNRVLQPISSEYPDFLDDKHHSRKAEAKHKWETEVVGPIQHDLKLASLALAETGEMPPETIQQFVLSLTHEEVVRGVFNQNSVTLLTPVQFKAVVAFRDIVRPEDAKIENGFMLSLKEIIKNWLPPDNLIESSVPEDDFVNAAAYAPYMHQLVQQIMDSISASVIHYAEIRQNMETSNALIDEILHHVRYAKEKAKEFVRREHVVEKITGYMVQDKLDRILPLVVTGGPGTGKAGVIVRALQKIATDLYAIQKKNSSPSSRPNSASLLRRKTTRKDGPNLEAPLTGNIRRASLGVSDGGQAASRRTSLVNAAPGKSLQVFDYRPVIIFRSVGLSHASSTSSMLMNTIAMQLFMAYELSTVFYQYENPVVKFSRALALAKKERPIILVITKLDQLQFDNKSHETLGWLLDYIPNFVNICISVRDSRSPNSMLPTISGKITSLVPLIQADLREKKGTIDASKWTIPVTLEQSILPIGDFIPTVAKVALKRYMNLDSRRLRPEQEDMVLRAFEKANFLDFQRQGTASPLLLRILYDLTRTWRAYDAIMYTLPVTVMTTLDMIFTHMENEFDKGVIATLCSILVLSRDGLATTEMEDILSLHDPILHETILWRTTRVTRISPVFFLRLFNSLKDTGLLNIRLGPNGIQLFTWSEPEFKEAAERKYLKDLQPRIEAAGLLADYFSGKFTAKKPFENKALNDHHLAEQRGLPEQPTKLTEAALLFGRWSERRSAWNGRKIRELPNALSNARRWTELIDLLYDIEIIEGMRETSGIQMATREIARIIERGKSEGMPPEISFCISHILHFLRERRYQMLRLPMTLLPSYVFDQLLRTPMSDIITHLARPYCILSPENTWQNFGRLQAVRAFLPATDALDAEDVLIHENIPIEPVNADVSTNVFFDRDMKSPLDSQMANQITFDFNPNPEDPMNHRFVRRILSSSFSTYLQGINSIAAIGDPFIITTSGDNIVRKMNAESGEEICALYHSSPTSFVSLSYCKTMLVSACGTVGDYNILIWDAYNGSFIRKGRTRSLNLTGRISGCGFVVEPEEDKTPMTANRIFVFDNTGTLKIVKLDSFKVLDTFMFERGDHVVCKLHEKGALIAIGGKSLSLFSLDPKVASWTHKATYPSDSAYKFHIIRKLKFTKDGRYIFALSLPDPAQVSALSEPYEINNTVIHKWSVSTGEDLLVYKVDEHYNGFGVSSAGEYLCIGGKKNRMTLVEVKTGNVIAEKFTSDEIVACDMTSGNDLNIDGTKELIQRRSTRQLSTFARPSTASRPVSGARRKKSVFSNEEVLPISKLVEDGVELDETLDYGADQGLNDALKIYYITSDNVIGTWKVTSKSLQSKAKGAMEKIFCSTLTADGDIIIMALIDYNYVEHGVTRIVGYDSHNGNRIFSIAKCDDVIWISSMPPGTLGKEMMVVAGSSDGMVYIWSLPSLVNLTNGLQTRKKLQVTTMMRELKILDPKKQDLVIVGYGLQSTTGILSVVVRKNEVKDNPTTMIHIWNLFTLTQIDEIKSKLDCVIPCNLTPFSVFVPVQFGKAELSCFARLPQPDGPHDVPPCLFVVGNEKIFVSPQLGTSKSPQFGQFLSQKSQGRKVSAWAQCFQNATLSAVALGDQIFVLHEDPKDRSSITLLKSYIPSVKEPITAMAIIEDGSSQVLITMTNGGIVSVYDLVLERAAPGVPEEVAAWIAHHPLTGLCISSAPSHRDACWRIGVWGPGGFVSVLRIHF